MRLYKKYYVREEAQAKVSSPQDVYASLKPITNADQESIWVLGYSIGNVEIYRECIFLGGIDACNCDPRILFKRLLTHDCSAFIMVHNHPGGTSGPSEEDKSVTKRLKDGGAILGIIMLDALIVSDLGYYSFKEHGCF